jgi:hypothetical protein
MALIAAMAERSMAKIADAREAGAGAFLVMGECHLLGELMDRMGGEQRYHEAR